MVKLESQNEQDGIRWGTDFGQWQAHMGVSPLSVPSELVLAAVGVDGRTTNTLRRHMGHILLEDAKRLAMRADMGSASSITGATAANRRLYVSPERCNTLLSSGSTVIYQTFPFEISQHSTGGGGLTWRGFVVRMGPALRMGVSSNDSSGSDVNFSQPTKPFVGLFILADNESSQLSSTESRFRFVLPLRPYSNIYKRDPSDTYGNGQRHYKDYDSAGHPFPDFTPEDGVTPASNPLYCSNPIHVTQTSRFIYIFSSTGEFEPVTIWYDRSYGNINDPLNELMSTRSTGWHWEKHGVVVSAAPTAPTETASPTGGFALAKKYDYAYRYVDEYRNRWTQLSPRYTTEVMTANDALDLEGLVYSAGSANRSEHSLHYPSYEMFGTIGSDSGGGQLRYIDRMSGANWNYDNRFSFYSLGDAATYFPFQLRVHTVSRSDTYTYPPSIDQTYGTEESVAQGAVYSLSQEPGATPQRVLAALHFQSTTILAEEGVVGGPDATSSSELSVSSGYVTLRWSCTSRYGPEIYPAANTYLTTISTNQPIQLVQAGDFAFLLGDGQVIRMRRVGSGMQVVEVLSGMDLVSSRAAVEANGMLFGVFRDGCALIEPSSGAVIPAPEIDRVIQDTWADSLDSVRVSYDAGLKAIILINRYTGTGVILWAKTQTVTALEGTNFVDVVQMRFRNVKRAVLVTNAGRFVVPRRYLSEDPDGTYTLQGITHTQAQHPTASRKFFSTVTAVAYDSASGTTSVGISDQAMRYNFVRDGQLTTVPSNNGRDYYRRGTFVYNLSEDRIGLRLVVESCSGNPNLGTFRVNVVGPATSSIQVGDVIAVDPVMFGVLLGPLESGMNETDGSKKRHAKFVSTVIPYAAGTAPAQPTPVFEGGVVDYESIKSAEPQVPQGSWWSTGSNATQQARRGGLPNPQSSFSTDDPAGLIAHVNATGHLLFPYLKCFVPGLQFEMKELWVRGLISPSEATI